MFISYGFNFWEEHVQQPQHAARRRPRGALGATALLGCLGFACSAPARLGVHGHQQGTVGVAHMLEGHPYPYVEACFDEYDADGYSLENQFWQMHQNGRFRYAVAWRDVSNFGFGEPVNIGTTSFNSLVALVSAPHGGDDVMMIAYTPKCIFVANDDFARAVGDLPEVLGLVRPTEDLPYYHPPIAGETLEYVVPHVSPS